MIRINLLIKSAAASVGSGGTEGGKGGLRKEVVRRLVGKKAKGRRTKVRNVSY